MLLLSGLLFLLQGSTFPEEREILLGISGHPLNTLAYNASSGKVQGVSYDTQVRMLREMGLSIYRMDVYTNPEGRSVNHEKFMQMLRKCRENGISVLPMIYDRCRYEGSSPAEAYQEGFRQMAGFARLYGEYIEFFELGNEMELFDKLKKRGVDGTKESHYNMERLLLAEQYIRGMEEGLKSVLPGARSLVNTAGFLPLFWMDRMFAAAPGIDICAWHVYSEMPALYRSRYGIDNIHLFLHERYGRPIWHTETNARSRKELSEEENEERALAWKRAFLAECRAEPYVEAVIFHELLDNPERGGAKRSNYEEEHFGFVKFDNYPGKEDPAAYEEWAADPQRYQRWSYKKAALELLQEAAKDL